MRDLLYMDRLEQAEALLKPQRVEVLRQLAEPRTCTEVAQRLEQTPQRVYYHVKKLVEADLVTQVGERRVRAMHEGVYQAAARSYWLSPQLVGTIGGRRQLADQLSLGYLLELVEEVQADLAAVDDRTAAEMPTLGISGVVHLRPDQRPEFLADLRNALDELLTRYGGADGDPFRLAVACYPKGNEQ